MDHIWEMYLKTLTKRKKNIEIAETIDHAIWKWYFDNGIPEPNWKVQKDPQWWIDYLKSLGQ